MYYGRVKDRTLVRETTMHNYPRIWPGESESCTLHLAMKFDDDFSYCLQLVQMVGEQMHVEHFEEIRVKGLILCDSVTREAVMPA